MGARQDAMQMVSFVGSKLASGNLSMRTISDDLLDDIAAALSPEEVVEVAIPSYRHRNPLLRNMAWLRVAVVASRLEALARAHPGSNRPRIMDYGCGTGVLLERASSLGSRVYGVDLILGGARVLVEKRCADNVTLLSPERARAEIDPGSLDIIVCGEVLEHLEPPDETLEFFRSRLAPGGRLLVSVPTENALYRFGRRMAGFSGHYHHSDAAHLHAEICRCGFLEAGSWRIPLGGPLSIYWVIEYRAR